MSPTNPLIIHVLARLKPTQCGLSDFALVLAGELEAGFGISSAFAVVNADIKCDLSYPSVYSSQPELLEACLSLTHQQPGSILVHLSGYGYSRDGAPAALAEALTRVRASGMFRIATYFHELYATSMPWRSAFWHSNRQKNAARNIAKECDLVLTNTEKHAVWLERETERESKLPIQVLPVFSNVGESTNPAPLGRRTPSLMVLGLPASRHAAYVHLSSLGGLLNDLDIHDVVDVGPASDVPSTLHKRPVRRLGALPPQELSDLLDRTMFGFGKHSNSGLGKSGILGAYCAHGTIPVIPDAFSAVVDGLKDGHHVISPATAKGSVAAGLQRISTAAWQWYFQHRLHVHAQTYARLLVQPSASVSDTVAHTART